MSEIAVIMETLEKRISTLFSKLNDLEEKNKNLKNEVAILNQSNLQRLKKIELLQNEGNTLKMTNSLLGSDDYKRDTKLKINSLVREIDYCIAQLAD